MSTARAVRFFARASMRWLAREISRSREIFQHKSRAAPHAKRFSSSAHSSGCRKSICQAHSARAKVVRCVRVAGRSAMSAPRQCRGARRGLQHIQATIRSAVCRRMADSPDQDQHHRVQCPACMGGHSRRVPADLQPKRRREVAVARATHPAPHAAPAQRPSRRRLQPLTRRGGCSRRRRGHKSNTAARNFRYKISTKTVPSNKETCLSIGTALLPVPIEVELQVPREIEPAIGIFSLNTSDKRTHPKFVIAQSYHRPLDRLENVFEV